MWPLWITWKISGLNVCPIKNTRCVIALHVQLRISNMFCSILSQEYGEKHVCQHFTHQALQRMNFFNSWSHTEVMTCVSQIITYSAVETIRQYKGEQMQALQSGKNVGFGISMIQALQQLWFAKGTFWNKVMLNVSQSLGLLFSQ